MSKASTVIFGWVLLLSFSYGGFCCGRLLTEFKKIHSLGVTAATDKHNAELLIQILNTLEGNPVKPVDKFVPLGDIISSEPIVEDNDVPVTFEQVIKDQREVDQSIRAFAGANLFQAETLHNILSQLTKDSENE